jgi:hypothetical protein
MWAQRLGTWNVQHALKHAIRIARRDMQSEGRGLWFRYLFGRTWRQLVQLGPCSCPCLAAPARQVVAQPHKEIREQDLAFWHDSAV